MVLRDWQVGFHSVLYPPIPYVANKMLHKATGEHFNKPGHKISDMIMTIIEKVHSNDPMVLSVREEHWIRKGNTKYRGINRNKG